MKTINLGSKIGGISPWAIWVGIFILVFGSIFLMASLGGGNSGSDTGAVLIDAVSPKDWGKGNAAAKTVLVEYGDFQCPACLAYHGFVKQLLAEAGDQVVFVYRHFPLRNVHQFAQIASQSAEAAGKQGKFWEMYDLIYSNQTTWSKGNDGEKIFEEYAQSLGLNMDQFKKDRDSDEVENKIENDLQSGIRAQVQGTPTFYLNGMKIENPYSYDDFKKLVLESQNAAPTPTSNAPATQPCS